jgi:TRAP-type C4-dicarboxylate transport system permease small subunit
MNNTVIETLSRIDRALAKFLKWLCISILIVMTGILTLSMIVRIVPFMSMHWFDEILEMLFAALIFYGTTILWMEHAHFSVGDWISKHAPGVAGRFVYRLIVEAISLIFIGVFFKYSLDLTLGTEEQTTAFAMPKKWLYMCMPISGGIMVIYTIKNMIVELTKILHPETKAGEKP